MENYRINGVLLIGVLSISLTAIAQSDSYTWSIKFGGTPFSYISNSRETFDWYGNSTGFEMLLVGVGYKNFNLSTTYRYFENATKKDLPYSNTNYFLPKGSDIRMVFWNINLSYEQEIARRLFIEPSLGFLQNYTTSNIMGFDGKEFDIKDLYGLTLGTNLIQYIKFSTGFYLGLYVGCNYNFIDYQKLNSDLKNNTFGYSIGVLMKGTNEKKKKSVKWL